MPTLRRARPAAGPERLRRNNNWLSDCSDTNGLAAYPHQTEQTHISQIALDASSRDDIPRILRGLQYIDTTPQVRERVFAILAEVLPVGCDADTKVSADLGRPGMEQWKILVLGTLRLSLNADYDRVLELSNQDVTIRQMLGHSDQPFQGANYLK